MKRKIAVLLLCVTMAFGLAACSSKTGEPTKEEIKTENTKPDESQTTTDEEVIKDGTQEDNMLVDDKTDGSIQEDATAEETMTGTLEENKGVMFTLISDTDKEAYVFPLTDDNKVLLDGISKGDKIVVSFTGGVPTIDNMATVVTKVELGK